MNKIRQEFWAWYEDGNVIVRADKDSRGFYFATQDAQYKNRIAHNMTALFEYYTKEFINQ